MRERFGRLAFSSLLASAVLAIAWGGIFPSDPREAPTLQMISHVVAAFAGVALAASIVFAVLALRRT